MSTVRILLLVASVSVFVASLINILLILESRKETEEMRRKFNEKYRD